MAPYFWPEEIGSAPYCTDIAKSIVGPDTDVVVYSFRPYYPSPERFPEWSDGARDIEDVDGLKIFRIASSERANGGFKSRIKNDLRFLFHVLRSAFSRSSVGVTSVVCFVPSSFGALAAWFLARWRGAPFTLVIHDIESGLARSLAIVQGGVLLRCLELLERFLVQRADHVVVLTSGMADELRRLGCDRPVKVLPIWAECREYKPALAGPKVTVGYSGNFGKKQSLDQLLPLIERLNRERPDVGVLLRGDGSERPRIMEAVQAMGVINTEFLDLVPEDQLLAALQSIDVHLVPQARNVANYALPSKLISIMAAGRAFVSIADPGSPLDVLASASGGGRCVRLGDDDELFRTVTGLLSNIDEIEKMGRRGQAYVRQHMDRSSILAEYRAIITPPIILDRQAVPA